MLHFGSVRFWFWLLVRTNFFPIGSVDVPQVSFQDACGRHFHMRLLGKPTLCGIVDQACVLWPDGAPSEAFVKGAIDPFRRRMRTNPGHRARRHDGQCARTVEVCQSTTALGSVVNTRSATEQRNDMSVG